jgi:MYXO-CTERM domain-containing protein
VAQPQEAGQFLAGEIEPNSDVERATPIQNGAFVRANIVPSGDIDYYRFTGQAGERVYASTMTQFSASSMDSVLTILGSDGTTVLEEDNDNGSVSERSSSIAGTVLPASGTYYLRVAAISQVGQIRPYDLHLSVRGDEPLAEVEPNGAFSTAQPIGSRRVAGSVSSASDFDLYSLNLNAGDTLFTSLDLDPERDGTSLDGLVAVGRFNGDGFLEGNHDYPEDGPDSESQFVTVNTSGIYYVLVNGTSPGTYELGTSVHPGAPTCATYTSTTEVEIPEGPGFITASLEVPDDVIIGDLNVNLRLDHIWPLDLDVHLIAPGGNQVGLFTDLNTIVRVPDLIYEAFDLTLDDEAAIPVDAYRSSIAGTFMQPEDQYRLHWFDGQNARGTWTLKIWDDEADLGGTLESWGLSICALPARPECPSGTVATTLYGTDFEADAGNFTHVGDTNQWARGTPSGASAPITGCAGGTSCFKTNLSGAYAAGSSSDLVSPSIDLAGVEGPITVQWAQAYQLENAQSDHASVDVREVGGGNPKRLFEFLDPTMQDSVGLPIEQVQESAGWGIRRHDISSYAGAAVELVFHQDANSTLELSGFAIDDVSVVGCIPPCGNGNLDDGEECDDGNRRDGDCCGSACQFEALGASCADADLCDGAETCNASGECVAGTAVVCVPSDECHVAGTCAPMSGCSNPSAPNGTACSNGSCQAGRCVSDGIGGAGGESGAAGDSGAGGAITGGQGGTAGTAMAGEGGEGATSGTGGTSTGGNNGGTNTGGNDGGTSVGGNDGGTGIGGEGGTNEGGEAGDGTSGSSKKSRTDESSGCGCHVVGQRARGFEALAFGALLLAAAFTRRRRFERLGPLAAR